MKVLKSHLFLTALFVTTQMYSLGFVSQAQSNATNSAATSPPASPDAHPRGAQETSARGKYLMFFLHVETLNKVAPELEAKGKDVRTFRTFELTAAGLTENEALTVNQIAMDCVRIFNQKQEQADAAHRTRQAENPDAPANSTALGHDRNQAFAGREQALDEHIAQLRQTLSPDSFAKLDKFVKNRSHPITMAVPPTNRSKHTGSYSLAFRDALQLEGDRSSH